MFPARAAALPEPPYLSSSRIISSYFCSTLLPRAESRLLGHNRHGSPSVLGAEICIFRFPRSPTVCRHRFHPKSPPCTEAPVLSLRCFKDGKSTWEGRRAQGCWKNQLPNITLKHFTLDSFLSQLCSPRWRSQCERLFI